MFGVGWWAERQQNSILQTAVAVAAAGPKGLLEHMMAGTAAWAGLGKIRDVVTAIPSQ